MSSPSLKSRPASTPTTARRSPSPSPSSVTVPGEAAPTSRALTTTTTSSPSLVASTVPTSSTLAVECSCGASSTAERTRRLAGLVSLDRAVAAGQLTDAETAERRAVLLAR